jgi:predicted GIY-YIG superfamily endonuclease
MSEPYQVCRGFGTPRARWLPQSAPFAVYLLTCTANGKRYVGKAADVRRRWEAHKSGPHQARTRHLPLYRAMAKHGVASFRLEVLSWHESEQAAFAAEIMAIARLGTKTPNGYNLTDGGEGACGSPPRPRTPEQRAHQAEKMRAAHLRHPGWQREAAARRRWDEGLCAEWRAPVAVAGSDGLYNCGPTGHRCRLPSESAKVREVARLSRQATHRARFADRRAEIVAARANGESVLDIALRFGIHKSRVSMALRMAGVAPATRGPGRYKAA